MEIEEIVNGENAEDAEIDNGEEEYFVQAIKKHVFKDGEIRFYVKWVGYDKKSDLTWEPEESIAGTIELAEYYKRRGGRESVLKRGSKRRSLAISPITAYKMTKAKEGRQAKGTIVKTSSGSWEEIVTVVELQSIDGGTMALLQWPNGYEDRLPLEQVYKRCPQKMLKFYESHLSFSPAEPSSTSVRNSEKIVSGLDGNESELGCKERSSEKQVPELEVAAK